MTEDYTDTPNKLRITRDEQHDESVWALDAVDTATGEYTEQIWHFGTHAEAVAAMPEFVRSCLAEQS